MGLRHRTSPAVEHPIGDTDADKVHLLPVIPSMFELRTSRFMVIPICRTALGAFTPPFYYRAPPEQPTPTVILFI